MRNLTPEITKEFDAKTLRPAFLIKLAFVSGNLFTWTGDFDLTFNGNVFAGLGTAINLGDIEEDITLRALGTSITVPVITSFVSTALQEEYQGVEANVWFAVFGEDGMLIDAPYECFKGICDVMKIEDNGEVSSITINLENEMVELFQPRKRYLTPEDQKIEFPLDKGLDLITSIQDKEIAWGRK